MRNFCCNSPRSQYAGAKMGAKYVLNTNSSSFNWTSPFLSGLMCLQKTQEAPTMNEYEIHISASYNTDGGTKEWSYFTEYVNANSAAEAKRIKTAELKADGYHNITMDVIKA